MGPRVFSERSVGESILEATGIRTSGNGGVSLGWTYLPGGSEAVLANGPAEALDAILHALPASGYGVVPEEGGYDYCVSVEGYGHMTLGMPKGCLVITAAAREE